jgi:hypothetical protein
VIIGYALSTENVDTTQLLTEMQLAENFSFGNLFKIQQWISKAMDDFLIRHRAFNIVI